MNTLLVASEPTALPSDPALERMRTRLLDLRDEHAAQSPRVLAGMNVLVVDDDQSLLQALTKILKQLGARVQGASSVSAAISYLTKGSSPLHLVLTDMRMPTVSGKCVLSALRGSFRHVPVIVMTAYATQTLRDECSALGAAAFIEKPFDTASLTEVIRQVIEERS